MESLHDIIMGSSFLSDEEKQEMMEAEMRLDASFNKLKEDVEKQKKKEEE